MAYLVLANGKTFEGERFGAPGDVIAELVFTTGVVGYVETLTDPSYAGQIVIQTFPAVGNYGICPDDFEGAPALEGYVVREYCDDPSNFRSQGTLDAFLKERGIPGLFGVDTREITRILREEGTMNAAIVDELPDDEAAADDLLAHIAAFRVTEPVAHVACAQPEVHPAAGEKHFAVTLVDYGAKMNIIRSLVARGCEVTVVPPTTTAADILAANPDGIMLSNGPGDPKDNVFAIAQIRELIGKVPVFGICLGHQLLALAEGGDTRKLKYGHRGANQPVSETDGPRTYITSQNHGYEVIADSLAGKGVPLFTNANDGSNEGMAYPDDRCFSVQFHPEACGGPFDTQYLFDDFLALMRGEAVDHVKSAREANKKAAPTLSSEEGGSHA